MNLPSQHLKIDLLFSSKITVHEDLEYRDRL